jgi:hypothetical protein
MRILKTLALALPLAMASAQFPTPLAAEENARQPTITMSGHGDISAAPDTAHISTGVVSEAKTAREALTANNTAMEKVIAELKKAGIEARDLQTSNFSVQPQYYHPPRDRNGPIEPPRIVGYQVSNTLRVRVRDLARLGAILDVTVSQGANQLNGIAFSIDDPEALLAKARKAAMEDAIARATTYAEAAGVALGRVLSISENSGPRPVPMVARMRAEDAAAAVPIEAGEQSIQAQVQVTWELRQ